VLDRAYQDEALAFFEICRARLNAPAAIMADWALAAGDEARRLAVLMYLLKGDYSQYLAEELEGRLRSSCMGSLTPDSPILASFNLSQKAEILGKLKLSSVSTVLEDLFRPPPPPMLDARSVFTAITHWWEQKAPQLIGEYEKRIYLDGHAPEFCCDQNHLRNDVSARQGWLELLILGATYTMGFSEPEVLNKVLRNWRDRGWLHAFADPAATPARWIEILEEYFHDELDSPYSFHWLRFYVPI